ncbi:MAG TPA: hypothetical protein VFQ15_05240, partial [Jiangellaceae bacterium]|nr:hypothetical protein [Jiangellaceae bacterium]
MIAITTAQADDSAGFMAQVQSAIDQYMAFFPTPDPAPPCRVTGVTRGTAATGTAVSLTWDDACYPGRWTDDFLARQYTALVTAPPGSGLARLRQLNPWLDDSLSRRMQHNTAHLHVYKSCNGGTTWTAGTGCLADTAADGQFGSVGYRPYASVDPTSAPLSFTDTAVAAGRNYVYALLAETFGADFPVIDGDSIAVVNTDTVCVRNCRVTQFRLAGPVFTPLSASASDPWVAQVYVPISRQAGAAGARVAVTDSAGPMPSDRLGRHPTADSIPAGTYRVLLGDSARATQVEFRTGSALDSVRTRVVLRMPATLGDSVVVNGTNRGGFTASGSIVSTVVTSPLPGSTETVLTHRWAGRTLALARAAGAATTDVLLASSTLTGTDLTPVGFHGSLDYPGFDLALDATLQFRFADQTVLGPDGAPVPESMHPSLAWQPDADRFGFGSSNVGTGTYEISWGGQAFGPAEPFLLTTASTEFAASLQARAAMTVGLVNDTVASRISFATGRPTTVDSLVAVRLPFRVRNTTFDRDVDVAMRRRLNRTVLLGTGADTLRVPVPDDAWVPGDTVFLIERHPVFNDLAMSRWGRVLACDPDPTGRVECNPLRAGSPGATSYVPVTTGQTLLVRYHTHVTAESRFAL